MSEFVRALDDCFLIRNDNSKTCKTCGQVHDFMTTRGADGSCDTPAVFPRDFIAGARESGPGSWGRAVPLAATA